MKKILLALTAILLSFCAYANTCTFDGIQVSLKSETVEIESRNGYTVGMIEITVDDVSKKTVRCHVEVGGKRHWMTVNLTNGYGLYNIGEVIGLPNGSYTVKLIQQGGMCY